MPNLTNFTRISLVVEIHYVTACWTSHSKTIGINMDIPPTTASILLQRVVTRFWRVSRRIVQSQVYFDTCLILVLRQKKKSFWFSGSQASVQITWVSPCHSCLLELALYWTHILEQQLVCKLLPEVQKTTSLFKMFMYAVALTVSCNDITWMQLHRFSYTFGYILQFEGHFAPATVFLMEWPVWELCKQWR